MQTPSSTQYTFSPTFFLMQRELSGAPGVSWCGAAGLCVPFDIRDTNTKVSSSSGTSGWRTVPSLARGKRTAPLLKENSIPDTGMEPASSVMLSLSDRTVSPRSCVHLRGPTDRSWQSSIYWQISSPIFSQVSTCFGLFRCRELTLHQFS